MTRLVSCLLPCSAIIPLDSQSAKKKWSNRCVKCKLSNLQSIPPAGIDRSEIRGGCLQGVKDSVMADSTVTTAPGCLLTTQKYLFMGAFYLLARGLPLPLPSPSFELLVKRVSGRQRGFLSLQPVEAFFHFEILCQLGPRKTVKPRRNCTKITFQVIRRGSLR